MNKHILFLITNRIFISMITLLIIAVIVFVATTLLPGDTATILLGQSATPEAIEGLRKAMQLDEPAFTRFITWIVAFFHGDLGISYANDMPVADMVGRRLLNSLKLASVTTAFAVPLSLFLGITTAVMRGSIYDRAVTIFTIGVISIPEFMVATTAVLIFAVYLKWLPALSLTADIDTLAGLLRAYAMPVITLTCVVSAQMIRMTRAAVIDALASPYVEMALLKGASRKRLVLSHALPNSLGPIANAMALSLSYLLGGVIIVETIFNYPGIAKLMVDAVTTRDLPLIQSCAMIFCLAYLLLVTIADLIAILSNPRLR
jgi:peptide/nickel transport system permease protein